MNTPALLEVEAVIDSNTSENLLHSDKVARQYGFDGALVSSARLFGHLCYLPVKRDGEAWFNGNHCNVRFISPAYDSEILTVELGAGNLATCHNSTGKLLAELRYDLGHPAPRQITVKTATVKAKPGWDQLAANQSFPPYRFSIRRENNDHIGRQLQDDLAIYQQDLAPIHPYCLLRECNRSLARNLSMTAWIHLGSEITLHRAIRCDEPVNVSTVITRKWQKRRHKIATFYLRFSVNDELRAEALHTAIIEFATDS